MSVLKTGIIFWLLAICAVKISADTTTLQYDMFFQRPVYDTMSVLQIGIMTGVVGFAAGNIMQDAFDHAIAHNVGIWAHALGGMSAGIIGKKLKISPYAVVGLVTAMAIAWEIYEYPENKKIFKNHYDWLLMDSTGDVLSSIGFVLIFTF